MVILVGLVIGGAAVIGIGVGCESSGQQQSAESVSDSKGRKIGQIISQVGGRYMGFLLLFLMYRADSTGSHRVSGRVGAPSCLQRGGAPAAGSGGVGI
jgi:hypothetical protein